MLKLHSPQHALTYTYVCFLSFLSLWTGLQASDLVWTISDTGWILNILSSFLEPWTSGACIFIHLLPKFDPVVILKVREDPVYTRWSESVQGLQFLSTHLIFTNPCPIDRQCSVSKMEIWPYRAHGPGKWTNPHTDKKYIPGDRHHA